MSDVRVGMRMRDPRNSFFPLLTVTAITAKGFTYALDSSYSLGSRHGVTTGGEHYGMDGQCLYELVDASVPAITWYPCVCGAEHDTPTCPFGAAPDASPAPQETK